MSSGWSWRHTPWWLLALVLVGYATLTPGAAAGAIAGVGDAPQFWCLTCTRLAGADFVTNILLFAPLGVTLVLQRMNGRTALLAGFLISCAIEAAQHFGLPSGRVSSASDILANSIGTAVGALPFRFRNHWLRPSPLAARNLVAGGAVCIACVLLFTSWALGRDVNSAEPTIRSALPFTPGFGWFHGSILSVTFDSSQFSHTGDGPVLLQSGSANLRSATVMFSGADTRPGFVPMLYVHGDRTTAPTLMIGQRGNDAEVRVSLRATALKLSEPSLLLQRAFEVPTDSVTEFRVDVTPERWKISERRGLSIQSATLPLTLSLGWTLFQDVVHVWQPFGKLMSALWIELMFTPLGYWLAFVFFPAHYAPERRAGVSPRDSARAPQATVGARVVAVSISTALLATMWWAPAVGAITPTFLRDFEAALAGAGVGALCSVLVRGLMARSLRNTASAFNRRSCV